MRPWEAGVVGHPQRVGVASSTGVRLSVSGDKPARWSGTPTLSTAVERIEDPTQCYEAFSRHMREFPSVLAA